MKKKNPCTHENFPHISEGALKMCAFYARATLSNIDFIFSIYAFFMECALVNRKQLIAIT